MLGLFCLHVNDLILMFEMAKPTDKLTLIGGTKYEICSTITDLFVQLKRDGR